LSLTELIAFFFRLRWPEGFVCPRCGHDAYYTIATRRLPLYQCRLCNLQSTVTSGTAMDRSRTPLEKWAATVECLSSTNGINAKQLAERIGVSHKTAWLMLRKFRLAIGAAEADMKLHGTVLAGLETLAPRYLFLFLPDRRFRKERVVMVAGSVMSDGRLSAIKIGTVEAPLLEAGTKRLTEEGAERLLERYAASGIKWLDPAKMYQSSLRECLQDAKGWMNAFSTVWARNISKVTWTNIPFVITPPHPVVLFGVASSRRYSA